MTDTIRTAVVCGAGGFIGTHLVSELKRRGYWVRAVDLKHPEFKPTDADEFWVLDLRVLESVKMALTSPNQSNSKPFDEVYQLAADMGGAKYIFTGENDSTIMHNSALINLHICQTCVDYQIPKVFYSSSACIYPEYNQLDPNNPKCDEASAYPAAPDSEYGWEKLFGERLYLSYYRNHALQVRIARFHNIFGEYGTWIGGREKAPAALCRKIATVKSQHNIHTPSIEIWGDGRQTRSFLYVDECVEGVMRLMESDFTGPINIGSDEMVTINQLARTIMQIAGVRATLQHITGPEGVRGRTSDNRLIQEKLGWSPSSRLRDGLLATYRWIEQQVTEQMIPK